MKNVITLITIFAIFAHTVAGCCWHFDGSQCCGDNASSSAACLASSHTHEHEACEGHAKDGHDSKNGDVHASVDLKVAHADDSSSHDSDAPYKRPGRHCEDNSCVVVLDTFSNTTHIDLHGLSGDGLLVADLCLGQNETSQRWIKPTNSLWSPLDRALAHQALLI